MMPEVLFDMTRVWMSVVVSAAGAALLASAVLWRATPFKCWRLHLWIGWVMNRLELCRRMYTRSRRPFRIILMRHAESEGNVDKGIYSLTPDHALKITDKGKRQAAVAGRELKKLIGDESVNFIVSPYTRTRMTYEIVREELGCTQFAMKEDPRLRELDFGNFQDLVTMEKTMETRKAYGRFWFRFMNGESGADVYDRATAFWESVFRSMDHNTHSRYKNYVIITHGLMMRLILMRYFQWKVAFFERVWNPDNCATWVMERDELGSYRVVTEILNKPTAVTETEGEPIPTLAATVQNGLAEDTATAGSVAAEIRGGATATSAELGASLITQPAVSAADATSAAAPAAAAAGAADTATTAEEDAPPIFAAPQLFRKLTVDMPDRPPSEVAAARGGTIIATAVAAAAGEGDALAAAKGRSEQAFSGQEDGGVVTEAGGGVGVKLGTQPSVDISTAARGNLDAAASALNLRDGGFAPGEEGCGRDEEL